MLRMLGMWVLAMWLSGCAMALQAPTSFNKQTDPYPEDYRAVARLFINPSDPSAVQGTISEPSVGTETSFGPRRWYSCFRAVTGDEIVIFFIGRGQSLAGPSPYFCDGKQFRPI